MGILSEDYNNINLEDVNFNEDYPKTIVEVRLGVMELNYVKHLT